MLNCWQQEQSYIWKVFTDFWLNSILVLPKRTHSMSLQNFHSSSPTSQTYSFPCHKLVSLSPSTSGRWPSANSNTSSDTATCHKIREVLSCRLKLVCFLTLALHSWGWMPNLEIYHKKSKPSREADLQKAHKREFRIPFFRLPPDNLMKSDITNTVGAPRLCLQHAQILGHPGQSTEHSSPAKSRISGSVLGHHSHQSGWSLKGLNKAQQSASSWALRVQKAGLYVLAPRPSKLSCTRATKSQRSCWLFYRDHAAGTRISHCVCQSSACHSKSGTTQPLQVPNLKDKRKTEDRGISVTNTGPFTFLPCRNCSKSSI